MVAETITAVQTSFSPTTSSSASMWNLQVVLSREMHDYTLDQLWGLVDEPSKSKLAQVASLPGLPTTSTCSSHLQGLLNTLSFSHGGRMWDQTLLLKSWCTDSQIEYRDEKRSWSLNPACWYLGKDWSCSASIHLCFQGMLRCAVGNLFSSPSMCRSEPQTGSKLGHAARDTFSRKCLAVGSGLEISPGIRLQRK